MNYEDLKKACSPIEEDKASLIKKALGNTALDTLKKANETQELLQSSFQPLGLDSSSLSFSTTVEHSVEMNDYMVESIRQRNFHENPILAIKPAIEQQIQSFEAELEKLQDSSLYVGLWLAAFGQQRLIFVKSIEFDEPCLIIFHGYDNDGAPLKLIQHVSQLSFLLEARKRVTDEPRKPIGFIHNDSA